MDVHPVSIAALDCAVQIRVYAPGDVGQPAAAARPLWSRLKRSARNNLYLIRRLFGGPPRPFRNLDRTQTASNLCLDRFSSTTLPVLTPVALTSLQN